MPWTDRFFPDYGYGLSPEIEAQLRRRGLMDFGINLLSNPRFSQLGPALGQARQGYGESARDYAQFERQKRYDESIASLRKSQVAENEAQARAKERADEIALLSRESALARLRKLAPDEVADYEGEPASVIRERLRELRKQADKKEDGFDYRSGDSPIVRVDKETGKTETIYTPPEKPEKPPKPHDESKDWKVVRVKYSDGITDRVERRLENKITGEQKPVPEYFGNVRGGAETTAEAPKAERPTLSDADLKEMVSEIGAAQARLLLKTRGFDDAWIAANFSRLGL